jgi:hypothetical protein
MIVVVPEENHGGLQIVLVGENAERGRAEAEEPSVAWREPEPACGEHSETMPVPKQENVPSGRACPGDHPIDSLANVRRRFASWASVLKDMPARVLRLDLGGGEPFIIPVSPFDEVGIVLGQLAISGQLAGFPGSLERTGKDQREWVPLQAKTEFPSFLLPASREGNVRQPGVLAGE